MFVEFLVFVLFSQRKLSNPTEATTALLELLYLKQDAIYPQRDHAAMVLQDCLEFCKASILRRMSREVALVIEFIGRTCHDDEWLICSTSIVLRYLALFYEEVIALSDQDRLSVSRNSLKVVLSPKVLIDTVFRIVGQLRVHRRQRLKFSKETTGDTVY